MYEYKAVVIDFTGSLVQLQVDLGFNIREDMWLLLHGIRVTDEPRAKQMMQQDIPPGTEVVLTAHQTGTAWTATVYHEGQTMNVNDMLVSEGYAVDLASGSPSGKAGK